MSLPSVKKSGKIPDHAQRVFSGVLFDVYQWEQKMFDGSTATFECLKRPDTVVILAITTDGKILLIRDEQPCASSRMTIPGGRIDPAESPIDAARRELLEETGYAAEVFSLYSQTQKVSKIDWTIYTFIAHNCRKVQEQKLDVGGERIAVQEVSFDTLLEKVFEPEFCSSELFIIIASALHSPDRMRELRRVLEVL